MPKKRTPEPTPEEKRQAAAARRPTPAPPPEDRPEYGQLVSRSFAAGPSRSRSVNRGRTHTISPVRVTATMAAALADYGNTNQLTPSETVRSLLADALGIDPEEESP